MTRRELLLATLGAVSRASESHVIVPLLLIIDRRAKFRSSWIDGFWSHIWPEAVRDFARCGIQFQTRSVSGEVRRLPSGQPEFIGLEPGVINFVITDHIAMEWD